MTINNDDKTFRDKPSPPPPPPVVARLLNSPLSTHPFETTGGGGGLSRKGAPVPIPSPLRSRNPPIRDKPLEQYM